MPATTTDLDFLLDLGGNINEERARLILDLVTEKCEIVVSPLPPAARSVVLSAAARAYSNPTGISAETTGPYSATFSATSFVGVSLTKAEKAELQLLAGRGGAFSIDPTPSDAGTALFPWDENIFDPDGNLLGSDLDPSEAGEWS